MSGIGAGIILTAIIIVLASLLCRRRQRMKKAVKISIVGDESKRLMKPAARDPTAVGRQVPNETTKSRPTPPQQLERPVSYTAGTVDAVHLQGATFKFDSANNYGSAGDELESVGTLPVHVPRYTTAGSITSATSSLDSVKKRPLLPKSSPSSNGGSHHKLSFDYNNPNLVENCLSSEPYFLKYMINLTLI